MSDENFSLSHAPAVEDDNRVLIAEDDRTSRALLNGVLKKAGYEVTAVSDGRAAWEILQQPNAPRLLILDWMMPEMDGLEVIQRVRGVDREKSHYIILLTGKNDTGDIIAGLEAGANDYVKKPFELEELFARLRVGQRMLELQRSLSEAHKAQSMSTMAAGVAHEINTPLQVVTGVLDKMLTNEKVMDDDELYRDVQMASRNSWRIAQITKLLLTYIQVVPMKKNPQNFNQLVENAVLAFSGNVPQNGILQMDLAPEAPDFPCDIEAFQQVMTNLLKNAFEAMPRGGTVLIKTTYDADKKRLFLHITDEGKTGIPEENRELIFDPFFTTKSQAVAKGMGLSIVRGIVKAHHGEITFKSKPGIGTTFTLSFPVESEPGASQ
ncbi:MAG TPA: hybrid sensor histidine kinase/response regulator [Anaerolineaceae bacterium]|nr:hybrid sensor histidine kinase/response regulator [Anaerolineaceae bacterium]HPN53238.1 hybrid sensor histidine kinase/response regulator [Anaerolineaceae bacterium]